MDERFKKLDPSIQKILNAYPVRNPVRWKKEHGIVVITYKKNLTRFERRLQQSIGGPEDIRRPMDEKGSVIWELCDGKRTVSDICDIMDTRYREEIEPVFVYVQTVLKILLERNLIHLEKEKPDKPLPVRKQRVIKNRLVPGSE